MLTENSIYKESITQRELDDLKIYFLRIENIELKHLQSLRTYTLKTSSKQKCKMLTSIVAAKLTLFRYTVFFHFLDQSSSSKLKGIRGLTDHTIRLF